MPDVSGLSRIGFGAYRASVRSPVHRAAIHRALDLGCNLVDTASSYCNGESELLIGEVLKERSALDAFVITKSGYVTADDARFFDSHRGQRARQEIVELDAGGRHCIHPDFLAEQLERSLRRLGRERIDAFLIHNPEYHLRQNGSDASSSGIYDRIGSVFGVAEELVSKGILRFYGISSNTFPFDPRRFDVLSVDRLVEVAQRVRIDHHFRFIQFPHNLAERSAMVGFEGKRSLIESAHFHGIRTIANRPLNARIEGTVVRLVDQEGSLAIGSDLAAETNRAIDRLNDLFKESGIAGDAAEIPALRWLREHGISLVTEGAVSSFWQSAILPLQKQLHATGMLTARETFEQLGRGLASHARAEMRKATIAARQQLIANGRIDVEDRRPLEVIACATPLRDGIDHLLVGMRRREYVESLKELFHECGDTNPRPNGLSAVEID
jgi:aryl-alcohol dehydrogenase-like predicted oxidoreductase